MIELTAEAIEALALRFYPILRFHEEERFYPLLAESWLTTVANGVWPESPNRDALLLARPDDPARRGASFCLSPASAIDSVVPIAGSPVDGDRPIGLDSNVLAQVIAKGTSMFMSVGGWPSERSPFAAGDIDYLGQLTSELAAAINPALEWQPRDAAEPLPPPPGQRVIPQLIPWQWIAQPPNVTMYCEVAWAGAWARRDARAASRDYGGARDLDGYVAFTYHLFYAARDPGGSGRRQEGQWEAVTLFFRADARPAEGSELIEGNPLIDETPHAVVISQGRTSDDASYHTDSRPYALCERIADRPVIYVTRGSHRNLFEPVTGETYDPSKYGPHAPDTTAHDNESNSWIGVDAYLILMGLLWALAALLAALLATVVGWGAAIFVASIIVLLILILLIMWIVSACDEASDRDAGKNVAPRTEPEEASTTGPQSGGDGTEEPAGPAPASGTAGGASPEGGGAAPTAGLPNTGSPTGRSTSFPDIRIIERLFVNGAIREHTGFPAPATMENPRWWDYPGRWGVQVAPAPASGTWESGGRRVDDLGRDWGYYCGVGMLQAIHGGIV
ncbi:hypothetical protein OG921_24320 [Aldersonia sp. NBC_00410]|uniref:hypothetical protein n=1 Tax=Aldersonia sp. NBC_00410 TaxID=2975954 RepID=UPI00225B063F|nr:hypothetical protein [Aldersonia sp. NBC_00410]MCX5046302.1 hypothetical protein [Aldersonia sp. NBC_00410]